MGKKGAFKGKLPEMDFTNISNVEAMLNEFSEENFNLDDNFMIPDLKNLTNTAPCVKRLEDIFEIMSTAEQVAFFGAYKAAQKNKTAENKGRCFAPRTLHKTFRKINKGQIKAMNKKMSSDSKKIRDSFQCVSKSIKQLGL